MILPAPVAAFSEPPLRHAHRCGPVLRNVCRMSFGANVLVRVALGLLLFPAWATAQEPGEVPTGVRIQGVVYDVATGNGISGATVLLSHNNAEPPPMATGYSRWTACPAELTSSP